MRVAIFVISSSCRLRLCHQYRNFCPMVKERHLFLLLLLLLLLFSPSLLLCSPQERLLCGEVGLSALLTSIQGRGVMGGGSPAAGDEDGLAVISGAGGGFTGSDGRKRKKMDLSSFVLPLSCCAVSPPLPLLIPPLFTLSSLSISSSPVLPFQSPPPFSRAVIGEPPVIISGPVHPPPLLLSPPLLHSSTLHPFSSPSTSFAPCPPFLPFLSCLFSPFPFLPSPHVPSSTPSPTLILLSSFLSPSPPCFPLILLSQLQCSNRFVEV